MNTLKTSTEIKPDLLSHTFPKEDVQVWLAPGQARKVTLQEKERLIALGDSYGTMLSAEQAPSEAQLDGYQRSLERDAPLIAQLIAELADQLMAMPEEPVLISLARGGTPVGCLLRRLMRSAGRDTPHHSISIIRGMGIDLASLEAIRQLEGERRMIFVDGWTGKGSIRRELDRALAGRSSLTKTASPMLAVISDPAGVADLSGSYQDLLIPHALLSGTISGLLSRSFLPQEAGAMHCAEVLEHLREHDQTSSYLDHMEALAKGRPRRRRNQEDRPKEPWNTVVALAREQMIDDPHLVKPGVGEATRAMTRRMPRRLILKDASDPQVKHLIVMATQRKVQMQQWSQLPYRAAVLIDNKLAEEREEAMDRGTGSRLQPRSSVSPWELGACLYTPATRSDLVHLGTDRYEQLPAIIYCTEDAVLEKDVPAAIENLREALPVLARRQDGPRRLIRARNPQVLRQLLEMDLGGIDGFVIPKVTAGNVGDYLRPLSTHPEAHRLRALLTLETREALSETQMQQLRDTIFLEEWQHLIGGLRIGGNDLLNTLGVRRSIGQTLYQGPLERTVSMLVSTFKPYGFHLSSPVYEVFEDSATLAKEAAQDLEYGLTGKTIIHPVQIPIVMAALRVRQSDLEEARAILDPEAQAVFSMNGRMCEPTTHARWANDIIERYQRYGLNPPEQGDRMHF